MRMRWSFLLRLGLPEMTSRSPILSLSLPTLPVQLERAAPFDGVAHNGSILFAHHQMDEGMRVAEEQLRQLPLQGSLSDFRDRSPIRMVRL